LYLLNIFFFGTERGIAPIAQIFFWGRIRTQALANSIRCRPVCFRFGISEKKDATKSLQAHY